MISIIYSVFAGSNWEGRTLGAAMLLDFLIQFTLFTAVFGKLFGDLCK